MDCNVDKLNQHSLTIRAKTGRTYDVSELWTGTTRIERPTTSVRWKGDYSPRPQLAAEILPSWSALAEGWSESTTQSSLLYLRAFFRFLDAYESRFSEILTFQTITESIGFLWLHPIDEQWEAAERHAFQAVGQILKRCHARKPEGGIRFSWPVVEDQARRFSSEKDLPTRDQSRAAITLLKREAYAIFARWRRADDLAANGRNLLSYAYSVKLGFGFRVTESDLHATYRAIVAQTGIAIPNHLEIRAAFGLPVGARLPAFWEKVGVSIEKIRDGFYPATRDLHCLTQLFMARTGWNPSTVYSLDIDSSTWATPHGNPEHDLWLIESWKERSSDWQQTICRGRVDTSPYKIVRMMIDRTEPLRRWVMSRQARLTSNLNEASLLRSPWICAASGKRCHGKINCVDARTGDASLYWHRLVKAHNLDVDARNRKIDRENDALSNQTGGGATTALIPRQRHARIPEQMVPSDWRDIYADFVFIDSRYAWVVVQWALGHKHILTTRHYLRKKLWRRYSESKLHELQGAVTDQIRHGRLDVVVIRSRLEFGYTPTDGDIARLDASRKVIREKDLTPCGYLCQAPTTPPIEIDPGNPSDGSMMCRRGERCPGCPIAIAVDPLYMVKRQIELELLRQSVSISVWMESHLASDLDVLNEDLKQWPSDEIFRHREFWLEEFRSGRRRLNRWSSMN